MSLLRSYNFTREVPSQVWELFKDMESLGSHFDYSIEIINNAMHGDIKLDGNFNLGAYVGHINKLKRQEDNRALQKILRINDNQEYIEPYSVPEDKLAGYVDERDDFEKVDDADEVQFAVKEINKLANDIAVYNRVNIYKCVQQAMKGIPDSIRSLMRLVEEDPYVGDMLRIVLSSGESFNELFGDK